MEENNLISAYLVDDITIIKHGGVDSWGEPLTPANIGVKGKIIYKTKLIRNIAGEEVVSSAMVYLLDRELTHEDRLKFDGVEHVILRIDKPKAFSNPHLEIYLA